jgi:AcrR family transcriptional regulator
MAAARPGGAKAAVPAKRHAILDAALDLFRHYGYRRTSMEDIAGAAGVAKGTLYLYFESKEDLFEALARQLSTQVQDALRAAAARDLPLDGKVLALLDAKLGFFYRWVLSSPHAAELVDSRARLPGDIFEPLERSFRAAIVKTLREGARTGEIDPKAAGLSLEAAADTLIAAAHGAETGAASEAEFRDLLGRITRLSLRGLRGN